MNTLYCACCGQPFHRSSPRGPAPLYCSRDCRRQMEVRRRVWTSLDRAERAAGAPPAPIVTGRNGTVWQRASA